MRRPVLIVALLALLLATPASALGALGLSEARVEVLPADSGSITATVSIPGTFTADVASVQVVAAGIPAGADASWIVPVSTQTDPVTPPTDVPFTLTVNVPAGTAGGTYAFDLAGLADGVEVGRATLAVAVPGAAGCSGPELTVDRAVFQPRWRQSRLAGSLLLNGRVCQETSLSVTLSRRGARPTRVISARVARPTRAVRLSGLPPALLPGTYSIRIEGAGAGLGSVVRTATATLAPPREGVVRDAFVSAISGGPRAVNLPGRRTQIWGYFRFAALPQRGQRITAQWIAPSGRAYPRVLKGRAGNVETVVSASPSLQAGGWRCVLRAGEAIVKVLRVSVGR